MRFSHEIKVGALVLGTAILAIFFAWMVGVENPFTSKAHFYVTYNFAGGIEVGSPVRVSGIKVGKVEKIEFFEQLEKPNSKTDSKTDSETTQIAPVKVKISVQKRALRGIREDSKFYINMAGIIGERYIEITPGSVSSPQIQKGIVLAGVDPPRIDQLISQSFDLAGKIMEIVDNNKEGISKTIDRLHQLSESLNNTVTAIDKSKIFKTNIAKLSNNLIDITSDLKKLTGKLNSPESEKTLDLLYDLIWRLEAMDSQNIRKFLQEEGIRARIF